MAFTQRWPERLWLVRHGQSQGNVARDAAHEAGLDVIDLDLRDVDVPLSDLGHQQAAATGRWFAALPEDQRPEIILSSPYIRAKQTAEAICAAGGLAGGAKPTILDERLRERDSGFSVCTTSGSRPLSDAAAHRAPKMGKFLPSRAGRRELGRLILRLRSALNYQPALCRQARVVVCHQGGVLCMRYILEELTEADHPRHRQAGRILNCGLPPMISCATTMPCGSRPSAVESGAPMDLHSQDRRQVTVVGPT